MARHIPPGYRDADDGPLLRKPTADNYGENHAFWIFDAKGEAAMLCMHVSTPPMDGPAEAIGNWDYRISQGSIVLPGRHHLATRKWSTGTSETSVKSDGFVFDMVRPFDQWTASVDSDFPLCHESDMFAGLVGDFPLARAQFTSTMSMVATPWVNGEFSEDSPAKREGMEHICGDGGTRYEQLFTHESSVTVDGTSYTFSGTGLRTHRRGPRNMGSMTGHTWATAYFPESGRSFGIQSFPSVDKRIEKWNESWLDDSNGRRGVECIEYPRLPRLTYGEEKFALVFKTPSGHEVIEGEVLATSISMGKGRAFTPGSLVLAHSMARFTWDGEVTTGLFERSTVPIPA